MKKLLRVSDNRNKINFFDATKEDCIKNFISTFGNKDLIVIADKCKKETIEFLKSLDIEEIKTTELGRAGAFKTMLDIAITFQDDDFIYFCDDDFLHLKTAPMILEDGLKLGNYVSLFDSKDKYVQNSPNPYIGKFGEITRIIISQMSYWKFPLNTKFSAIAVKTSILKEDMQNILKHLNNNNLDYYECFVDLILEKDRTLICCLPGQATECNELCSPFIDWQDVIKKVKEL